MSAKRRFTVKGASERYFTVRKNGKLTVKQHSITEL